MSRLKKLGDFLKNIQKQPEDIRKIILWSVVIIISLGFFFLWLHTVKIRLKTFQKEKLFESIGVPQLKEELKEMPKIEVPEIKIPELSEEELKQLEEMMKETENTSTQP